MSAPALAEPHRFTPDRRESGAFLADALKRDDSQLSLISVPAPEGEPEALLARLRKTTSVLWSPPGGDAFAGHGAAADIVLSGKDRIAALQPAADELFASMHTVAHPALRPPSPRLFGGWSFEADPPTEEPWSGFGAGRFVLPRWSYARTEHGCTLTLAVDRSRAPLTPRRACDELDVVWDALSRPLPKVPAMGPVSERHVDEASWAGRVDEITRAIGSGQIEKVVAARRAQVFGTHDFEPWAVLHSLAARYPDTWRFALRFGRSGTFLGATPERLFSKRGQHLVTDALAGSIGVDQGDASAALRASTKDRREHRPVVEHLLERLEPLCSTLELPGTPTVRRLPNVLHLHTEIRGELRPSVHAAAVATALHPTPAVGGFPSTDAERWIRREEGPRGWYAGPVGWIDANGDAEIGVALRCGVVRGNTAWAWAGCGIVAGSEPGPEWRESQLKMSPVLDALRNR